MAALDRFGWIWGAFFLACGAALCFVPLFNLLAFEFAFAIALPATFCAGAAGVRWRRRVGPGRAWLAAGLRASALTALALLPITANALRVRNCDYLEGLLFFALLPGVTVWVAAAIGVALGGLRRATLLFVLVVLASLGLSVARFWLDPPVDAFNLFMGYYPGSLYDEVIPIGARLLWSRAEDLGWAAAAVGASSIALRPRPLAMAALGLAAAIGLRIAAVHQDVHRDAAHVQAALGGYHRTAHLDVYHPARWPEARVEALTRDLEFAYAELSDVLGVRPSARPSIYLYPDQGTKKRLMGAGRTRIAKPWQRALHIHAPKVGDPVTIHELAHVFSADLAEGPLHLSMRGPLPHMGLIEGLAVAATWESGRLDPHQWSAAMRRIGVAPPLTRLLDPTGFLSRNSRTAYTLCGSFVRFQRDEEGPAAVAETYRAGGVLPPERLPEVVTRWERFLDGLPLDPRALEAARARFDRPAIFQKVCAHEVAALRREAGLALGRADFAAALATLEILLGHVPGDVRARLAQVGVMLALDRPERARALAAALADDPRAGALARGRAREWLADLDAAAGRLQEAGAAYATRLEAAFDRDQQRRLAVKRAALAGRPGDAEVLRLLTAPAGTPRAALDALLDAAVAAGPRRAVIQYLDARRQLGRGERAAADGALRDALASGLPHPALEFEARRLRARVAFDDARYAEAAAAFDALAARPDLDIAQGERFGLRRWARRARFFANAAGVDTPGGGPEDAAASPEE